MQRVLTKVEDSNADVILIAPGWSNQPWVPALIWLLVEPPFRFPIRDDLIAQNGGRVKRHDLQSLLLHAWLFSGSA